MYRYRIVNTEDSSKGSTAVYIEPNYADVKYKFVTFTLKNMERVVYMERPKCENIEISWATQTRQQITGELNSISDDIAVHVTRAEMASLGYRYDTTLEISDVNVYELLAIGKTAKDVDAMKLDDLTDEQLAHFGIGKDSAGRYSVLDPTDEILLDAGKNRGEKVYFSDLSADGFALFNNMKTDVWGNPLWTVSSDNSVKLKDLSDAQLAQLGVSESGDVLTFNGKICFRYYVAELEDYYDTESRKLSFDLLNT